MGAMAGPAGRREAGKQARRAALTAAAHRLFSERGFEATSVRDIALAAGLTERTFYRYFDGKEGLLAEEYESLLKALGAAIRERPAAEQPLTAIRNAMLAAIREARAREPGGQAGPVPVWLFSDRPFAGLRRLAPRPLVRMETAMADAVLARLRADAAGSRASGGQGDRSAGPGQEYQAQVVARIAVAALRSAAIRHRQLRRAGEPRPPAIEDLLGQAFAIIGDQHIQQQP